MGFFDISGDTLRIAEAAGTFDLAIPADARETKKGGKAWTEHMHIIEAWSEVQQRDAGEVLLLVAKVEVDNLGSRLNDGKTFEVRMAINQKALGGKFDKGSVMDRQKTMSIMAIGLMKRILEVSGIKPGEEGYDQSTISECFPDLNSFAGLGSPIVGTWFWGEISTRKSISQKTGREYTNYDVGRVLSDDEYGQPAA